MPVIPVVGRWTGDQASQLVSSRFRRKPPKTEVGMPASGLTLPKPLHKMGSPHKASKTKCLSIYVNIGVFQGFIVFLLFNSCKQDKAAGLGLSVFMKELTARGIWR